MKGLYPEGSGEPGKVVEQNSEAYTVFSKRMGVRAGERGPE